MITRLLALAILVALVACGDKPPPPRPPARPAGAPAPQVAAPDLRLLSPLWG